MLARVDAHQHFWSPGRGDYGWLRADDRALAPLVRDFQPEHLQPLLTAHGVVQTVLVQAAPSEAETDYMLSLASAHAFIAAVVGWVDLSRVESVGTLERWARHPKFKGVRPMLQDLPDAQWIAHAPHPEVMHALVRLGLRFDALVQPWHLAPLLAFARAWPTLPLVIDHCAKPQLRRGWSADWVPAWRQGMAALAALPQVMCKVSGLATEAAEGADTASSTLRPAWDAVLRWFGPERLMWGSDWPVLTLADDYAGWAAVADGFIGELPADAQAWVWSGSARRFYALGDPGIVA